MGVMFVQVLSDIETLQHAACLLLVEVVRYMGLGISKYSVLLSWC